MIVMKFGGTSVGGGERILGVARIVLAQREARPVVVTSALSGVTDALLEVAQLIERGEDTAPALERLARRHREAAAIIAPAGDWQRLEALLAEVTRTVEDERDADGPRRRDALAAFGERLAVTLVAGALASLGGATLGWDQPVIATDDHFGEATPEPRGTRRLARAALAAAGERALVLPGFIGVVSGAAARSPREAITTLGRGGSDYSATLIAAALGADACWIYTDVDGIYTADPRVAPEARVLPVVSDATAGRLAMCGAKVLHPRSVAPAARHGIELRVRNTFRPEHTGTLIAPRSDATRGMPLAVAGRRGLASLGLAGPGLSEIATLFGRLCAAVTAGGAEIIQATHPVPGHDPAVLLDAAQADAAATRLTLAFAAERAAGQVSAIECQTGLALLTLVGDDLDASILLQAQRALASERVVTSAQSANADALSFVMAQEDLDRATRALHSAVILPAFREVERRAARPYPAGQWAAGGRAQRHRRAGAPQH